MYSLKYLLKKDPKKNIKLAKEFLEQKGQSSSEEEYEFDYDDQAKITLLSERCDPEDESTLNGPCQDIYTNIFLFISYSGHT